MSKSKKQSKGQSKKSPSKKKPDKSVDSGSSGDRGVDFGGRKCEFA